MQTKTKTKKPSQPGEVVGGKFDAGSYMMEAGCHHTTSSDAACGGCYARLSTAIDRALELIREENANGALKVLQATVKQRQAEAKK